MQQFLRILASIPEVAELIRRVEEGGCPAVVNGLQPVQRACVGAAVCQQGVRDSQSALRAAVEAVRAADLPDGALPRVCISGCPSSCSAHQAGAIGFQGCVKPVDGKPQPAFRMFLGGSDQAGRARFGEPAATILERDLPALMVELGRAAAQAGQSWEEWSQSDRKSTRLNSSH